MDHGESQWTKSIRNQVRRLTSMTQQLITLSKLDEGEVNGEKTRFFPVGCVDRMCSVF